MYKKRQVTNNKEIYIYLPTSNISPKSMGDPNPAQPVTRNPPVPRVSCVSRYLGREAMRP